MVVGNGAKSLCRVRREWGEQLFPVNGGSGACTQCQSPRDQNRNKKWNACAWDKHVRTSAALEEATEGQAFLHDMLRDPVELSMRIGQDCGGNGPYDDGAYAALRDFNIH